MSAYFILWFLPAFFAFISSYTKYKIHNRNRIIIDLFFFTWLVLLMMRSMEVGTDLLQYEYNFKKYSMMSWEDIVRTMLFFEGEVGFVLISKIVKSLSLGFRTVMIICALISVVPIWYLYRNEAENSFVMIVLFLNVAPFAMYFSGLRQAMAMAFVVPCYYFCRERKVFQYILMIICAYMIHRSAIVLLLMYPVYHMKIKKKINLILLIPIIGLLYANSMSIFKVLLSFMESKYIDRYAEGIRYTGAYNVLLLLCVFLIYSFVVSDNEKLERDTIGLRNILVLCVILQVFAGVHTIAMRMNYYYLLFVPITIAKIMNRGSKKFYKIIKLSIFCIVIFFSVYFFYNMKSSSDILGIFPYVSMLKNTN